jgi:hypothetical protein
MPWTPAWSMLALTGNVGDFVDSLLHTYSQAADIKGNTLDAALMDKLSQQAEDFSNSVQETIVVDDTETITETESAKAISYRCI